MTFTATLILLGLAVALVASAATLPRGPHRRESGYDNSAEGTGPVESELLRRRLRSRRVA